MKEEVGNRRDAKDLMDEHKKHGFDEMTIIANEEGRNVSLPVIFLLYTNLLKCTHRCAMQRTACLHLVAIANQGHTFTLTKYMLERIRES
jgi:hypothetical protein